MIITTGCLCGFRSVARYLCGCARVFIFEKCVLVHPCGCVVICDYMWSSRKHLPLSLSLSLFVPPPLPLALTVHLFELDKQAGLQSYW